MASPSSSSKCSGPSTNLMQANIPMKKVVGSRTSVHTGCFTDDYKLLFFKDPQLSSQYAVTGLAVNMLANRLSWFFDLSGSSINLDTACSSSMVALDLACKELRSGDATMVNQTLLVRGD